uniref:KIAA1045 RING finger domain-containing protein n=1 Tax=Strix occidentalis caurina TaxID=311401 RepID=A0A8D0ESK8_STROC
MGVLMSRQQTVGGMHWGTLEQPEENSTSKAAWEQLLDGQGLETEDPTQTHLPIPSDPQCSSPPAKHCPDPHLEKPAPCQHCLSEQLPISCQVLNDDMREICEVWTAESLFPCHVCSRVYHDGCLHHMGYLWNNSAMEAIEMAHTETGWSCYYCDNLSLLLMEEEMYSLMEILRQCKIIPETCLTLDSFLHYKHLVHKQQFERPVAEAQEEQAALQFSALDPDKKEHVKWHDFLSHKSIQLLQKLQPQNALLWLLTAKEREWARVAFQALDQDSDGFIREGEDHQFWHDWFRKHQKETLSCNVSISYIGPMSESSSASDPSFLQENIAYILATHPNSAALHLQPLA